MRCLILAVPRSPGRRLRMRATRYFHPTQSASPPTQPRPERQMRTSTVGSSVPIPSNLCCAEGVANWIGVDAVEVVRVALLSRRPAERTGPADYEMIVSGRQLGHRDIKVYAGVLSPWRDRSVGPLECQPRSAPCRQQDQPVIAGGIGCLMARRVGLSEKPAVELGKLARLRAVQGHFVQVERFHARP